MFHLERTRKGVYLKNPRLQMSAVSRFVARLLIYSIYTIAAALTLTFILSDIPVLHFSGLLLLLFLLDRLLHIGEAEESLLTLQGNEASLSLAHFMTPAALHNLEKALDISLLLNSNFYLQLARILMKEKDVVNAMSKIDIDSALFTEKIESLIEEVAHKENGKKAGREELLLKAQTLSKEAFALAQATKERFIEGRALFGALAYSDDIHIKKLFAFFSINPKDLESALIFARFHRKKGSLRKQTATIGSFASHLFPRRHRFMNRAWTARPTPLLDAYSVDLTDMARRGEIGLLINHEKEYDHLIDVLARPSKPNALLVGDPGVGKESIVSHLAFQIIKDRVPQALFDKRVVTLALGRLVSGAAPEEISRRITKIADEIIRAQNIILYAPDIHILLKTSGEHSVTGADIFVPFLASDSFPVIGATYPKEYKELALTQTAFASAFEEIRVGEITENDAIQLLTYDSIVLEELYATTITFSAVKEAVKIARTYFHERPLPSSAEDLLKEAVNYCNQRGEARVKADAIIAVAERRSTIPIHRAGKQEANKLLHLEDIIHERLVDQGEAVHAVSEALREYRSGLARSTGPIATFLFVGPTGVGKTELAKILANIQFGSDKMLIRFDMSEYQDKASIQKLIGSSDGKMAGNLTESVLQKPYSLLLLDEFEKAHPDILNIFLQVFDDGRLTDNLGRTVEFVNTMIIATSNAHSDFIKSHIDAHTPMDVIENELKKKLKDFFHPELLNRFSKIIMFKTLSLEDTEAIARIQLDLLAHAMADASNTTLSFDESVVRRVAELGFDPSSGARPMREVIAENLRSVLAEKILKDEINKGSRILVSVDENGAFQFTQEI